MVYRHRSGPAKSFKDLCKEIAQKSHAAQEGTGVIVPTSKEAELCLISEARVMGKCGHKTQEPGRQESSDVTTSGSAKGSAPQERRAYLQDVVLPEEQPKLPENNHPPIGQGPPPLRRTLRKRREQ